MICSVQAIFAAAVKTAEGSVRNLLQCLSAAFRSPAPWACALLLGAAVACAEASETVASETRPGVPLEDLRARLAFTITQGGESVGRLVYVMYWKDRSADANNTSKALFFTEEPPTSKGFAYMGWFRPDGNDDAWLYIPELRTVRRMTGSHTRRHDHRDEGDDPFDASVLQRLEMEPRPPNRGARHTVGTETIGGQAVNVVDTAPPATAGTYPYRKVRTWISRRNGLPLRTRYLRPDGTWKEVETIWKRVDGAWVWDRVVALDTRSGAVTTLEMSDIRVNTGLTDRFFSERTMKRGLGRISR